MAVVKGSLLETGKHDNIREQIKHHVYRMQGPEYPLAGVISLSELQLSEWPKSSSDKLVKRILVDAVEARRECFGL